MEILFCCNTGSRMYNLVTEKSDADMIVVYNPTREQLIEKHLTGKSLRYYENITSKDEYNRNTSEAVDILYMDIYTFVQEYANGCPNIFEVVCNKEWLEMTNNGWEIIQYMCTHFDSQNLINSYKKMAKKYLDRYRRNKRPKDLYHALRSAWSFDILIRMDTGRMADFIDKNVWQDIKDYEYYNILIDEFSVNSYNISRDLINIKSGNFDFAGNTHRDILNFIDRKINTEYNMTIMVKNKKFDDILKKVNNVLTHS